MLIARRLFVGAASFALAACGDAAAPRATLDRDAVAGVMPAVMDAVDRLVPGIEDEALRDVVRSDLQSLARALESLDGSLARHHLRAIGSSLAENRRRMGDNADASEVYSIELMLAAVSEVTRGEYVLSDLQSQ